MKHFTFDIPGGGKCHAHSHSNKELEAAWHDESGQGNSQARARGSLCVIVPCTNKALALVLSDIFHRHFAIETCCHWDGKTVSMYCGDAGSGYQVLMNNLKWRMVGMGLLPDPTTGMS